jgi:predicted enzyme related to lactoylglutathione lyase
MKTCLTCAAGACLIPLLIFCAACDSATTSEPNQPASAAPQSARPSNEAPAVQIHYLEIVTPDVDATCALLEQHHGVRFGDPVPELGNARTTDLADGGRISVRAPMRATETPVVRPYLLVDDITAAVKAAEAAGAEIAIPSMEIPGQGTFAIYLLGGIEHGLWQR